MLSVWLIRPLASFLIGWLFVFPICLFAIAPELVCTIFVHSFIRNQVQILISNLTWQSLHLDFLDQSWPWVKSNPLFSSHNCSVAVRDFLWFFPTSLLFACSFCLLSCCFGYIVVVTAFIVKIPHTLPSFLTHTKGLYWTLLNDQMRRMKVRLLPNDERNQSIHADIETDTVRLLR